MATSKLTNIPVTNYGSVSALPAINKDGLAGFVAGTNIPIGDINLMQGTRIFGYCYNGNFRGVGMSSLGTLVLLQQGFDGTWSILNILGG